MQLGGIVVNVLDFAHKKYKILGAKVFKGNHKELESGLYFVMKFDYFISTHI